MPVGISDEDAEKVRAIIQNPIINEILFLTWHGVPFDVAWSLDPLDRFAWCIICGQFEGNKFNLETFQWVKET